MIGDDSARYKEYLAILSRRPAYRRAFDRACEDYLASCGKEMPLDNRLYLMVFAPVLTGFVRWAMEQAAMSGKKRLYFLSRDGYQMYLIAQSLAAYGNFPVECRYLHVSRYSMRIPGYHLDMEGCLDSICVGGIDVTPLKILRRGALTEEECREVSGELQLGEMQDKILNYRQVVQLKGLFAKSSLLKQYIRKHSMEAYDNAAGYLKQEGLCRDGRFAIVDSGWIGTLQCSIEKLVQSVNPGIKVEGYYFGMYDYPGGAAKEQFHTYYFSPENGLARKVRFSNSLFETVVSAEEGMTSAYRAEGGRYFPVLKEQGNPNSGQLSRNIEALGRYLKYFRPGEDAFKRGITDIEIAEKLLERFMAVPTALEYGCYGRNLFSDDLSDDGRKEVAAELTWSQIRDQRLLNKLLIMCGCRKAVICESAWLEGSAFGAASQSCNCSRAGTQRRLARELRHIRLYKRFVYLKKLWALKHRVQ